MPDYKIKFTTLLYESTTRRAYRMLVVPYERGKNK
jgi:hypothetical protein